MRFSDSLRIDTIHIHSGGYCVYSWDEPELPARISNHVYRDFAYFGAKLFKYPVKLFLDPIDPFYAIAVQTDVYPLLWIWVYLARKTEQIASRDFYWMMARANAIGIAETEPFNEYSWKDFLFVPTIAQDKHPIE